MARNSEKENQWEKEVYYRKLLKLRKKDDAGLIAKLEKYAETNGIPVSTAIKKIIETFLVK